MAGRAIAGLWSLIGLAIILSAYFQWFGPGQTVVGLVFLATVAAIIASALGFHRFLSASLDRLAGRVTSVPLTSWVAGCLVLGASVRVVLVLLFPPEFVSDPATYWALAQDLAAGERYEAPNGRSFWPPGLPIALAPFALLLGSGDWVPAVFNLVLFAATAWVALRLAELHGGTVAARMAVLIIAIWPNHVLFAGIPAKEALAGLLLPAAVLLYLYGERQNTREDRRSWWFFTGSGVCLGFATLTQPATAFFGLVLVSSEAFAAGSLRRKLQRLGVTALIAVLTVLPWTARNYYVHGVFIPVNTAGGPVLLSANNDNATGGWIADELYLDSDLVQADEVTRDRLARERALRWIFDNPQKFAKLMVLRETRLLCCDNSAAHILFFNPQLQVPYDAVYGNVASTVSDAFWIAVAIILVVGVRLASNHRQSPAGVRAVLVCSVVYFMVIFSVFQSEGKQLTCLVVFFAVQTATVLAAPSGSREARAGEAAGARDPERSAPPQ